MKFDTKSPARQDGRWVYVISDGEVMTLTTNRDEFDKADFEARCGFKMRFADTRFDARVETLRNQRQNVKQLRKGNINFSLMQQIQIEVMAERLVAETLEVWNAGVAVAATDTKELHDLFVGYMELALELLEFSRNGKNFERASPEQVESQAGKSQTGSASASNSETMP